MVQAGTVALHGTKLAANAAGKANRTHAKLEAEAAEILRQAAQIDHIDRAYQTSPLVRDRDLELAVYCKALPVHAPAAASPSPHSPSTSTGTP